MIIINPKSGKGKAVGMFKSYVRPILEASGCNVVERDQIDDETQDGLSVVHTTTRRGEASALASLMDINDYDAILCVGGDGTIHEVINGLASRTDGRTALAKLAIGTIPAGTFSS
jgi:sphingosine kinase